MNIAAFIASSSRRGNTATAALTLLEAAKDKGASVRPYFLNEYQIKPCVGCRICEKTHQCFQKDDCEALHDGIRRADAYILATPTYYGDITGQFKMFVDRVYPFIDIKKDEAAQTMSFGSIIETRKPGILIAVSGSHGERVFDSHTKVAFHCLNDINGYLWRQILIPYTTWTRVEHMEERLEELRQAGRELVDHLSSGEGEDLELTRQYRAMFS